MVTFPLLGFGYTLIPESASRSSIPTLETVTQAEVSLHPEAFVTITLYEPFAVAVKVADVAPATG